MAVFAPVYRPSEGQQTLLARQQKRERKRKREPDDDEQSREDEGVVLIKQQSDIEHAKHAASIHHPVGRTDPYHVAGHPREALQPPHPFPHAPLSDRARLVKPVDEELAALNPPLYVPKEPAEDRSTSSKRRHVDSLTTILHVSMLRGDWTRAVRAWGLLLRTEIAGQGPDVRRNGRWGIGAELLMRRKLPPDVRPLRPSSASNSNDEPSAEVLPEEPVFFDEGFQLVQEYYERLILQYPHTPRTHHSINAVAFYPALFNVWVYGVQDRSKRARQNMNAERPTSSGSEHSADFGTGISDKAIKEQELQGALQVARRMDELMLSPPYDGSLPLLQLRGMIGLWLADLYTVVASLASTHDEGDKDIGQVLHRAGEERQKTLTFFKKISDSGGELPRSVSDLLNDGIDEMSG